MKRKNLLTIVIVSICLVVILVCFGVVKPGGLCADQNQDGITKNVKTEVKSDVNIHENEKVLPMPDLKIRPDSESFPKDQWCCWKLVGGVWRCGPCY